MSPTIYSNENNTQGKPEHQHKQSQFTDRATKRHRDESVCPNPKLTVEATEYRASSQKSTCMQTLNTGTYIPYKLP